MYFMSMVCNIHKGVGPGSCGQGEVKNLDFLVDVINHDDDDGYDNFCGTITQHMPLQGRLDKKP